MCEPSDGDRARRSRPARRFRAALPCQPEIELFGSMNRRRALVARARSRSAKDGEGFAVRAPGGRSSPGCYRPTLLRTLADLVPAI